MSVASAPFTQAMGGPLVSAFSDKLEQPAELKVGIAYTMDNIMLTADAKQIKWSDAEGYKDFNWEDQNVFALGAKYSGNGYWLGAGYNYSSDPIKKISDIKAPSSPSEALQAGANQVVNMFNNHFFPGIVESHITFGGGYSLTKNTTLEGAVVYAPEVEKTVNTGYVSGTPVYNSTSHTVKHSQLGYTVSLKMNF